MLAPRVTADAVPTAGAVPAVQIVGPTGGGQSAPQTFCAVGYYDDGIGAITITLRNAMGNAVVTAAATLVSAFNFWYCRVTVPGSSGSSRSSSSSRSSAVVPPSSSSSSRSSASLSSGSSGGGPAVLTLGVYRLEATPDVGQGDAKDNVVVDPTLGNQTCSEYTVPEQLELEAEAAAAAATTYVRFPYEYPDPTDPAEPLHELIVGSWAHKEAGKMVVYHYPPVFTENPTKARNYWLPYYGPGIYFARFVRVEAFGAIHSSQTFAKPQL